MLRQVLTLSNHTLLYSCLLLYQLISVPLNFFPAMTLAKFLRSFPLMTAAFMLRSSQSLAATGSIGLLSPGDHRRGIRRRYSRQVRASNFFASLCRAGSLSKTWLGLPAFMNMGAPKWAAIDAAI